MTHTKRYDEGMSFPKVVCLLADNLDDVGKILHALSNYTPIVNPQTRAGVTGPVCQFDEMGIYGVQIRSFFRDLCSEDIETSCAVLEAVRHGLMSEENLKTRLSARCIVPFNKKEMIDQVREKIPGFAPRYKDKVGNLLSINQFKAKLVDRKYLGWPKPG